MRKSSRVTAPLIVISGYYLLLYGLFYGATWAFPGLEPYMPIGGIAELVGRGADTFEQMEIISSTAFTKTTAPSLAIAIIAATALLVPISWVYFITTRSKQVSRSFAQTMIVLPVIVAGIAMIVQNSLALAFSLAGVVAAVRFRFSLEEPAHALYIFAAIGVGLGAGIGALGIGFVTSLAFVLVNLVLWKLDYGADLTTPFFSFMTGRGRDDNDL